MSIDSILIIIAIGCGLFWLVKKTSSSGSIDTPSTTSSSVKTPTKTKQFEITPDKFDQWRVSFDKDEDKWVTAHSFYGDYNEIHIPTGIYLSREQINVFFKGMEIFKGNDINFGDQEEGNDYSKWTSFLKKDKLFKDWYFDDLPYSEMVHIQDFFWQNYDESPSNYKISDPSYDIDKRIDLFIELAQKGLIASIGGSLDIRYLSSDLEVLLYDDPSDRQYRDYTVGHEEVDDEDDPFVTDVQFSRENIELLMKFCTETYLELGASLDDLEVNEEKHFTHWLKKVKKISDFNMLWFPEKDKVIGEYYSAPDDNSVSGVGVKISYNGKTVESLWTELWGSHPFSHLLKVYRNWDDLSSTEIDKVVDKFMEKHVGEDASERIIFNDDLFYISKPSNAPVKASTITI